MKRNYYIPALRPLLHYSLGSCSDVMDVTPDGRLSLEEVFANPDYTAAYFPRHSIICLIK